MLIGVHLLGYGWSGSIGTVFGDAVRRAEDVGAHSLWLMDHFFGVPQLGGPDEPMLECYTALAWAAGRTTVLQLGALVTGVPHRHPGVLVKTISTLDVLSDGRAWLGLGAAWNAEEARGLGVPFPPLIERYERLEETLQIARRMFAGDTRPFDVRHYRLERPLNEPAPIRRPPILVGGLGEQRTLRLVARYADACNVFDSPGPDGLARKLDVLRRHCDEIGRPYDEIVKTTFGFLGRLEIEPAVDRFAVLAEAGVDLAIVDIPDPTDNDVFVFIGQLVRAVGELGRPAPAVVAAPS